jgi:hypothetical protein
MSHVFKKIFAITLLSIALLSPVAAQAVSQSNRDATCEGAQLAGASVDCTDKKLSDDQFGNLITAVINTLSVIVGAVSVIMIIIGGFRYVISSGDSNAMSGAKNTILYAIIGLVIVLFAQVIVRFVITNVQKT